MVPDRSCTGCVARLKCRDWALLGVSVAVGLQRSRRRCTVLVADLLVPIVLTVLSVVPETERCEAASCARGGSGVLGVAAASSPARIRAVLECVVSFGPYPMGCVRLGHYGKYRPPV